MILEEIDGDVKVVLNGKTLAIGDSVEATIKLEAAPAEVVTPAVETPSEVAKEA